MQRCVGRIVVVVALGNVIHHLILASGIVDEAIDNQAVPHAHWIDIYVKVTERLHCVLEFGPFQ